MKPKDVRLEDSKQAVKTQPKNVRRKPAGQGGSKVRRRVPKDTSVDVGKKPPKNLRQTTIALSKPFTTKHARMWAKQLILDNGKPWILEPFQLRFLADLFAGRRENLLVLPEGNAKTTLVAGLVLYHLEFTEYARAAVAAASRYQAGWLYQAMSGFIERSDLKQFRAQEGYLRILCEQGGSRAQVFAADDRTGDGAIPTFAVLEELHRHRNLNLYRTWRGKLEKRGGQLVGISTAGEPDGEFEALRKAMRDQATEVSRDGAFLRAVSKYSVLHEYCVPEDGDPDDLRQVLDANPLRAITRETLKRKRHSPAYEPAHWRRFVCGMPARMEAWIQPKDWDALRWDVGTVTEGEEVTVAVRVGVDAGIGIAALRDDGRVAVATERVPAPPDGRVSLEAVEFALRRLDRRYRIREICYDRDQFERSADLLRQDGLPMSEEPQSAKRLATATQTFWRLVSGGLLGHDGSTELREQVLAGVTKETTQGWHLVPTVQTSCLIAVAMAAHVVTRTDPAPPEVIAL